MRKISQVIYPTVLISSLVISSCSTPTNMLNNSYTVSPNPLEMKGDSILITMSANIPAKSINAKANIQFTPYLKSAKGELPLKSITVGGEAVTDNVDFKVSSKTGGKVTFMDKIPYTDDLKRATLYPDFALKIGTEYKTIEQAKGSKALAEGTITTPLLVKTSEMSLFDQSDYTVSAESKAVNIFFPMDVSKFNPSFKAAKGLDNKNQIAQLKKLLKSDSNWVVKGISINAFASPDGELQRNSGLSQSRAESTFNYFKKELKKLGFTEVNDVNFKMGYTTAEDWKGYTANLETSTHPDKEGVLAIVRNTSISDEEREGLIRRNYPKFWEASKSNLLPSLRRSELEVKGQKPLKTDDELKASMNSLDKLKESELLHLAAITADMNQKINVYNAYITKAPNDWRGYNGVAAAQIRLGKQSEAMAGLEKANSLSPENAVVLANMGACYRAKGDVAMAEKMYKAAAAKGADVNYNMGLLAIKRGNYNDAVSLIAKSGKNDFNYALAQVLNGNSDQAKTTIANMKQEDKDWACYYLSAIIGARANSQDDVTTNLTRAVQMNAEVRQKVKEDMEFAKFWNNPAFEGAIR